MPRNLARFNRLGHSQLLLFSTDYPHWQFERNEALPEGLSADLARKIMVGNPSETYLRIARTMRS